MFSFIFVSKRNQSKRDVEKLVDEINEGRPQCPVGLNTLVIPRKIALNEHMNQPYVYLNCGHVQGKQMRTRTTTKIVFIIYRLVIKLNLMDFSCLSFDTGNHDWGQDKSTGARRCPMCLEQGAVVTLCMGCEPAFYVDFGPPTYAFNPCGHMATEKTVKYVIVFLIKKSEFKKKIFILIDLIFRYWASVDIPHGTMGFQAICPFCATPLDGSPGYIKLIFQDNLD